MKDLAEKERDRIEARRQEIIDEGAKQGQSISIEKLFERIEAYESPYKDENAEEYATQLNEIKKTLIEKYGTSIPVDEAYRIMSEFEEH